VRLGASLEVVKALLKANPEAAGEDEEGSLPLHTAVTNGASLEVVEALLAANPGGAAKTDNNGEFPLHWAVGCDASKGVVDALLKANPDAAKGKDEEGKLPLLTAVKYDASEEVVKALLAANPGGAAETDDNGNLPLHVICSGATLAIARELVRANPEALLQANADGLLPLHTALRKPALLEVLVFLHTCCPAAVSARCPNETPAPGPCEQLVIETIDVSDELVTQFVATCFDPAADPAPVRSAALQLLVPLIASDPSRLQREEMPEVRLRDHMLSRSDYHIDRRFFPNHPKTTCAISFAFSQVLDWAELISGNSDPLFREPRNLDCLLQLLEAAAANGDLVWAEGDTDK
jgi:ankyrin repeat protein